jgi:hypothetical protein
MVRYGLGLCLLLLVGCATIQGNLRLGEFDEISSSYGTAIRWKQYGVAAGFIKGREPDRMASDLEGLNKICVTSYEVLDRDISEDKLRIEQIVRIAYFNTAHVVEKRLFDKQLWEYDETDKTWYLKSGLPDFR